MHYVIFDMDGVLVDSEPIHMELEEHVFAHIGIDFSEAYHHTLVGMAPVQMWEKIKIDHKISTPIEELLEIEKELKFNEIQKRDIAENDHVGLLLDTFKKEAFKLSVGSSSPKKIIEAFTKKTRIQHYFDYLVSSEDVARGKPFPDIFLEVARLYNEPADSFVVIEDSKNGVTAAKAAGMKCIGYRNLNSGNQDLSEADFVITRFSELSTERIKVLF
ncbi:HAD family phosphatase [Leptobacterium sp. I13]|uniref:HAD family hydrolase n=1 Tax=Leptobacterium meishanense TaxID=3128904 RepID=UPI0030EC1BB9